MKRQFLLEFYHRGGCCWFNSWIWLTPPRRWPPRWMIRDVLLAYAYGRFRQEVETYDWEHSRKITGLRLVELNEHGRTEIVRYMR